MDATLITAIIGLVVIVVIALVFLKGKSTKRGNALMIIGLCQSGKTTLFFKLKDGKIVQSHTSVKENYAKFVPKVKFGNKSFDKEIEVVDIPGSTRVRKQLINEYLPITKQLIYVLDSSELDISSNAEFLYDILTDRKLTDTVKPAITIIFNKSDISFYVKNQIKRDLEKELITIHNTKKHQHQSIDEDASSAPNPLVESKEFTFEGWSSFRNIPVNIEFCSVAVEGDATFEKVVDSVISSL